MANGFLWGDQLAMYDACALFVYQNCGDDELQRTIWLTGDSDGTVSLTNIQNLYGKEKFFDYIILKSASR